MMTGYEKRNFELSFVGDNRISYRFPTPCEIHVIMTGGISVQNSTRNCAWGARMMKNMVQGSELYSRVSEDISVTLGSNAFAVVGRTGNARSVRYDCMLLNNKHAI